MDAADRSRAARVLATVRASLQHFRSRAAATAAGYDDTRGEAWSSYWLVARGESEWRWPARPDFALPAALVYAARRANGSAALVGAVYAAQSDAAGESLDGFVPLSIARWAWFRRRCSSPHPPVWLMEVFPFDSHGRIWRIPSQEM